MVLLFSSSPFSFISSSPTGLLYLPYVWVLFHTPLLFLSALSLTLPLPPPITTHLLPSQIPFPPDCSHCFIVLELDLTQPLIQDLWIGLKGNSFILQQPVSLKFPPYTMVRGIFYLTTTEDSQDLQLLIRTVSGHGFTWTSSCGRQIGSIWSFVHKAKVWLLDQKNKIAWRLTFTIMTIYRKPEPSSHLLQTCIALWLFTCDKRPSSQNPMWI